MAKFKGKVHNKASEQGDIGEALKLLFGGLASGAGNLYNKVVPSSTYSSQWKQPTNRPLEIPAPVSAASPSPSPSPVAIAQQMLAENTRPSSSMPVVNNLGRNPDITKKPLSPQVKQAIEAAASEFGVPASLLYDIGYSEGGFRPDAANETPQGQAVGVPRGLFQFTPNTWDLAKQYAQNSQTSFKNFGSPDINDPSANARAAAYLLKFGQLGRWQASKPNWGRFYTEDELAPYYSQTLGYKKGETFR